MGKTPRALVGIDKNGQLLLTRIPFEVTLEEAAKFIVKQGALFALNLQGDSGAVFWFDGKIHPLSHREPARFCEVMVVKS